MEGCGDEVVVGISFRAGGGVEMGTTVNGAKTKRMEMRWPHEGAPTLCSVKGQPLHY